MDSKEQLRSMLQDIINDREEQASVSMHDYLVAKMREVSNLGQAPASADIDHDLSDLETE